MNWVALCFMFLLLAYFAVELGWGGGDRNHKDHNPPRWGIWIFVALILPLLLCTSPVLAHSWYEWDCCAEKDCKPVADGILSDGADGIHISGYGVLPYNDPKLRWSRDNGDHLCLNATGGIRCVYRRFKGM